MSRRQVVSPTEAQPRPDKNGKEQSCAKTHQKPNNETDEAMRDESEQEVLKRRSRRKKIEDSQSEEVEVVTKTKKRTLKQTGIAESEEKQDQTAGNGKRRKIDGQATASYTP